MMRRQNSQAACEIVRRQRTPARGTVGQSQACFCSGMSLAGGRKKCAAEDEVACGPAPSPRRARLPATQRAQIRPLPWRLCHAPSCSVSLQSAVTSTVLPAGHPLTQRPRWPLLMISMPSPPNSTRGQYILPTAARKEENCFFLAASKIFSDGVLGRG